MANLFFLANISYALYRPSFVVLLLYSVDSSSIASFKKDTDIIVWAIVNLSVSRLLGIIML